MQLTKLLEKDDRQIAALNQNVPEIGNLMGYIKKRMNGIQGMPYSNNPELRQQDESMNSLMLHDPELYEIINQQKLVINHLRNQQTSLTVQLQKIESENRRQG